MTDTTNVPSRYVITDLDLIMKPDPIGAWVSMELYLAQAARIEELEAEMEEQVEWVRSLAYDLVSEEGREARLKEKLAKAVEALDSCLLSAKWSYYGTNFEGEYAEELATLAELKGETE